MKMTLAPFALVVLAGCSAPIRFSDQAEERARAIWAIAAKAEPSVEGNLLDSLSDPDPLCRNFAAWGLSKLPPDPERSARLREILLSEKDAGVIVRALLALAKEASPENAASAQKFLSHDSFHVRRAAIECIGSQKQLSRAQTQEFRRHENDPARFVRMDFVLARAKLEGDSGADWLREKTKDSDPWIRSKAAEACAFLSAPTAESILRLLAADADIRPASAAMAVLRSFKKERWAHDLAIQGLLRKDLAVRGEAVETIENIGDAADLKILIAAFDDSAGPEMNEAREKILLAAAKLSPQESIPLLERGLMDLDDSVRAEAADHLTKISGKKVSFTPSAPKTPQPGRDFPRRQGIVRATIETERGNLQIELYPEAAPIHVENFIHLARAGKMDNTIFHRVVSNWVVQGADPRGDGWGAISAWGGSIPDELNANRYVRGSIGMPKGKWPGTGGSQIFITLIPTPKLDGAYTHFGQVVEGLDILDRIDLGDKILRVRVVGP